MYNGVIHEKNDRTNTQKCLWRRDATGSRVREAGVAVK